MTLLVSVITLASCDKGCTGDPDAPSVSAQAQAALEQTLFQSLAEGGVAAQDVSVQLAASGAGEVTVEQVTAVVLNEASGPAAKALIQSVLGQQVSVTAVTPGREGDGT